MKYILVLLLFAVTVISCGKQQEQKDAIQQGHAMISVPTIQCQMCVETIQTAVKKVEGVTSVNVDLKEKMAHVNFDAAKTSQEKIEKAIAAAGYDANNIKRDEAAYAKLPACCQLKRE
jgi:periplasmic mercuric ion binding protein